MKLKLATLICAMGVIMSLATTTRAQDKDIVDTAVAAGSFKTLATALTEAGLIETLKSNGPFTVFAPTDEAFAKIPKAQLEALLKEKEALTKVLTYHVVKGKVPAGEVVKLNGKAVGTVEGSTVKVKVNGDKVMVNNANVVKTDIMTSNGVIHVIDTVIMPKMEKGAKKNSGR
ncbi:MAG TPA: fasciclin domain-containing protein [Blastocatellia bacterium]|nr:fasciclin domain-containing protein [Blastocatellia bacterium]